METDYISRKTYKDTSVMTNNLELTESSLSPIIAIVFQQAKPPLLLGHNFWCVAPVKVLYSN